LPGNPRADAVTFAALGDETRLALVERLRVQPLSIVRLTDEAGMTRQAVTKHLRVLEKAELVTSRRIGRTTVWQLQHARFNDARTYLDTISRQWDNALERLRVQVEAQKT